MAEIDNSGNLTPPVEGESAVETGMTPSPAVDTGEIVSAGPNPVVVETSEEDISAWWQRIERARTRTKQREGAWDELMKAYLPLDPSGNSQDVRVSIHFRNVHSKIGQLFYQVPELVLSMRGPMAQPITDPVTGVQFGNDDIIYTKQAILNDRLSDDGVDASRLMDELLFDVLAWAGIGASKIGYKVVTKPVEEPVLVPDPNWAPPLGSTLGLKPPTMVQPIDPATGQPAVRTVPVPIFEEPYWCRFSPKKLLIDDQLKSTRYDKDAAWMGMDFFMPEHVARKTFNIPDDVPLPAAATVDDRVYEYDKDKGATDKSGMIHGVEVWYKAFQVPTAAELANGNFEVHPEAIRQIVLIDGVKDRVVVHRPSPDQTFDRLGKLTPDSMVGFPIHVLAIRDMADSPYPLSDTAFTNSEVRHVNVHRQQSVKLRDRNIGKFAYDSGQIDPDEVDRIKNGEVGDFIGLKDGALREGVDKVIVPLLKAEPARDDYRLASMLEQDVEKTLGLGGPQVGAREETVRTATEISTIESKSGERIGKERSRVIKFFLAGVRKFDALIMRYTDEADYVEIVGEDGAKAMRRWDKNLISVRCAYKAKPDSQLKLDVAQDRAQTLKFLEVITPHMGLVGPEPIVMALKKIAEQFGMDPSKIKPPVPVVPGAGLPGAPGVDVGTGRLPNAPDPGAGPPSLGR